MSDNQQYNTVFQNWNVKRLIGSGSYGKVYELERIEGDAVYQSALKVITIPQSDSEIKARMAEGQDQNSITSYYKSVAQSLLNENRVMAELRGNSNIVSYEDHQVIHHSDGIGCDILIRMELLTSFIDYMASHEITEDTVIRLGIDICKALEICERKSIIHRDIKPGNIFVSDVGDFKLGDFGIARTIERTTGGLSKKGTYRYMAPEVYRGDPYGKSVDICSLGLVMYYLSNGNRTPFLPQPPAPVNFHDEEEALIRRMRGEMIPPPRNASPALASIILKACAYNEKARYGSASEMRRDLEALQNGTFHGAVMKDEDATVASWGTTSGPESNLPPWPQAAGTAGRHPAASGQNTAAGPSSRQRAQERMPIRSGTAGSIRPASPGAGMPGTPMPAPSGSVAARSTDPRSTDQKKMIIIGVSLLAVLLLAAIVVFGVTGRAGGSDPSEPMTETEGETETLPEGIVAVDADITVLDAEFDWDSSRKDPSDNTYQVDAILWVKNHSEDDPVVGMDFYAIYEDGSSIKDAKTGEELLTANGYVAPGKKGVMVCILSTKGEVHKKRRQPDDDKIRMQTAYTNDALRGYTVPTGKIENHDSNDYYDVIIDNSNDVEVSQDAILTAVWIENDGLREADATGRLREPIPAEKDRYYCEGAFHDPHFHIPSNQKLTIYAIDDEYYKNAR